MAKTFDMNKLNRKKDATDTQEVRNETATKTQCTRKTDASKTQEVRKSKFASEEPAQIQELVKVSEQKKPAAAKKKIKMGFDKTNYSYLVKMSDTYFINRKDVVQWAVRELSPGMPAYIDAVEKSKISAPYRKGQPFREKGNALDRITIIFDEDVYDLIASGAEREGMNLSQYVNTIIDLAVLLQDEIQPPKPVVGLDDKIKELKK